MVCLNSLEKKQICYYCPPFLLHIFFSAGDRILSFELKILSKYLDEEGIRICASAVTSMKTFSYLVCPLDTIFIGLFHAEYLNNNNE